MNTAPANDVITPEMEHRAKAGAIDYASGVQKLSRAVKDGYPIDNAVATEVTEALLRKFEAAGLKVESMLEEGTEAFQAAWYQDRAAPRDAAFQVLDTVSIIVADTKIPDGWEVEVSRVQKYRPSITCRGGTRGADPHGDRDQCHLCRPLTAVLVWVAAPIEGVREHLIIVNAEAR